MNTELAERLMLRVDAARRRLTDLDAGRLSTPQRAAEAVKVAVREVDEVHRALRHTTEQLHVALDDLAEARKDLGEVQAHYAEFRDCIPMACLLTDACGTIADANHAASELLNVGRGYLIGKAMLLFLPERDRYFNALETATKQGAIWLPFTVRPRERKPRSVTVAVFALPRQQQYSWLLSTQCQEPSELCASTQ